MRILVTAKKASRPVKMPDLSVQMLPQRVGCQIRIIIQIHLLPNNPPGHGVDVGTNHRTTEPVCLYQGSSAAHEWIEDTNIRQMV